MLQGEKTALGTKNPGKQDICESEKVFCNSNMFFNMYNIRGKFVGYICRPKENIHRPLLKFTVFTIYEHVSSLISQKLIFEPQEALSVEQLSFRYRKGRIQLYT